MVMFAAEPTKENELTRLHTGDASRAVAKGLRQVETVAKYMRRFKRLQEMRQPIEQRWRDVRDNLNPAGASVFLDGNKGDQQILPDDSNIYHGTPRKMAQTAADGLHGGLSNPAAQWFDYYVGSYEKYDSEASGAVKEWMQMAQECVRDVLANSNFYSVLHPLYRDWLEFGVGMMMACADPDKLLRFYHHKPGAYWIAQNNRRIVDTVYIKHVLRASDIVDTYGFANCPLDVRNALDAAGDPDRKFVVVQCIQPWGFFGDAKASPMGHQYEDVRFVEGSKDDDPVLFRGGYLTKPFIVARWSEVGDDVYPGSCPGIDALPDILQLYKEMEDYNLAREWRVNPAFWTDDPSVKSISPGEIIPVSNAHKIGVQVIVPPIHDIATAFKSQAELIERISAILYNREIMMISGRAMQNHQMTATEAQLLDQEKSAIMGPIVVRGGLDILVASLDRSFEIITREWVVLDEPPEEIRGQEIRPHFTSNLAITQRQAEMQRLSLFDQWVMTIAAVNPGIWDYVKVEQRIRLFEKFDIVPPNIISSPEEIQRMQAARAKAAQAQQQLATVQQGADIAAKLGGASTAPGTMLGDMTGAENGNGQ